MTLEDKKLLKLIKKANVLHWLFLYLVSIKFNKNRIKNYN